MKKYAHGWITLAFFLIELVGEERGLQLIETIDESHLRHHGHAQVDQGRGWPE
jgi:hypothetical protein